MKLSVAMITYNHEQFIVQALESVLMQQVNFDYEIVIGEDCSTDKTRDILIRYQQEHPDKIRLLLPDKNLGMHDNYIQTFKACRGDYIAFIEGDDYWTSTHKLQKQVDFLDNHSDCAIVYHIVELFDDKKNQSFCLLGEGHQKIISTLDDFLLFRIPIQTSAVMFRRELLSELPEWIKQVKMVDVVAFSIVGQYGNFGFINENMSVWRWHSGGVWTSKNKTEHLMNFIDIWKLLATCLESRYKKSIFDGISNFYSDLATEYLLIGDFKKARDCFLINLLRFPLSLPRVRDIKGLMKIFFPHAYKLYLKSKIIPSVNLSIH